MTTQDGAAPGLGWKARAAASAIGFVGLGVGGVAVLETDNEIGSLALVLVGSAFLYLGISGQMLIRLKVGDHEAEFGRNLEKAEAQVDVATESSASETGQSTIAEPDPEEVREAEENPSSSILIAWERFTRAQQTLAEAANISVRTGTHRVAASLEERGVVNRQYVEAVGRLQRLRNSVAHGQAVPRAGESANFVQLAGELRHFAEVETSWLLERERASREPGPTD